MLGHCDSFYVHIKIHPYIYNHLLYQNTFLGLRWRKRFLHLPDGRKCSLGMKMELFLQRLTKRILQDLSGAWTLWFLGLHYCCCFLSHICFSIFYIQGYVSDAQDSGNFLHPTPFLCQAQIDGYMPPKSMLHAYKVLWECSEPFECNSAYIQNIPLWTASEEQNLCSVGLNTLTVTWENIWVIGLLQGKGAKGSLRNEKNKIQLLLS